jgi:hypothetical protein
MKERLKEHNRRLKMLLKSEQNAKNKIAAIRASAVPLLRYSFGIIIWRLEEIRKIDRTTRKVLTMYKINQPKAKMEYMWKPKKP